MPTPTLELIVATTDMPEVAGPEGVSGWGDDGHETQIVGRVTHIRVALNGDPQFSLRITDNGQLILTGHHCNYSTLLPANLVLDSNRPWPQNEDKGEPE